jgi:hypothetical protein
MRFFASCFFNESPSPKPPKITLGSFRMFSKIRGDSRKSSDTVPLKLQQRQTRFLRDRLFSLLCSPEVGGSATCSAMRISATCATRKNAAEVRFNPQSADCGIAPAH